MLKTKYKTILLIIFYLLILSFQVISAQTLPLQDTIIMIDPGHGGRDSGTYYGKILEKDINLEISKVLEQELSKKGAIVYMTRKRDIDLSSIYDSKKKRGDLYRRLLLIKDKNCDLYISIQSDSLGLTTASTTAESFEVCADLIRLGAVPADIEDARRELMRKSPRVLSYKGQLIERIEYFNDGRTAYIHIPFEEIHEYSNEYNPTMLVLDEMRLVTGVDVAIGIKTYPDGKLTGKIRSNIPVSNLLAKTFGGDGHAFAAGFRTYVDLADFIPELVHELDKLYDEYDANNGQSEAEQAADAAIAKAEENEARGKHADLSGVNLGGFRIKRKDD